MPLCDVCPGTSTAPAGTTVTRCRECPFVRRPRSLKRPILVIGLLSAIATVLGVLAGQSVAELFADWGLTNAAESVELADSERSFDPPAASSTSTSSDANPDTVDSSPQDSRPASGDAGVKVEDETEASGTEPSEVRRALLAKPDEVMPEAGENDTSSPGSPETSPPASAESTPTGPEALNQRASDVESLLSIADDYNETYHYRYLIAGASQTLSRIGLLSLRRSLAEEQAILAGLDRARLGLAADETVWVIHFSDIPDSSEPLATNARPFVQAPRSGFFLLTPRGRIIMNESSELYVGFGLLPPCQLPFCKLPSSLESPQSPYTLNEFVSHIDLLSLYGPDADDQLVQQMLERRVEQRQRLRMLNTQELNLLPRRGVASRVRLTPSIVSVTPEFALISITEQARVDEGKLSDATVAANHIVAYDLQRQQVTYRRIQGICEFSIAKGAGHLIDCEMWLAHRPTALPTGLAAAMSQPAALSHRIRTDALPVKRIRSIKTALTLGVVSLSPSGRWFTEYNGFGLRVRDAEVDSLDVDLYCRNSDGLIAWDQDDRGFVRLQPRDDDPSSITIEYWLRQEESWKRSSLTLPRDIAHPIEAVAINVEREELLLFDRQRIRCFAFEVEEAKWEFFQDQTVVPTAVAWSDQSRHVYYADRLLKIADQGEGSTITTWELGFQPQAGPQRNLWQQRFSPDARMVWASLGRGLVAFDIDSGEEVGAIEQFNQASSVAIADQGNLAFLLADSKLHVFDLNDLSLIGSWSLPTTMGQMKRITVSSDGRRVLLSSIGGIGEQFIVDFEF